jgi:hypothetical protein
MNNHELNNCNRLANKWGKEFKTIFPEYFEKHWSPGGQHCLFKKNKWDMTRKLIFTSSNALTNIQDDTVNITDKGNTVIAWEQDKDTLFLCHYCHRNNPFEYYKIHKIDNNSFSYSYAGAKKVYNYRPWITEPGKTINELDCYFNCNLVNQMIGYYKNDKSIKSLGGKNKSSAIARWSQKRNAIKRWGLSVICDFSCPEAYNREEKTFMDAYKIAVADYGYGKTLKTFTRQIKKGQLTLNHKSMDANLVISLKAGSISNNYLLAVQQPIGMSIPTVNEENNIQNSEIPENSGNPYINIKFILGMDIPKEQAPKDNQSMEIPSNSTAEIQGEQNV